MPQRLCEDIESELQNLSLHDGKGKHSFAFEECVVCACFGRASVLHADAVHCCITVSSFPFSIHIHVDTWPVPAWLIRGPMGKPEVPAINKSEVAASLKTD